MLIFGALLSFCVNLRLQSLQVLKNLSLDGATSYSPVLLWFPMLGQQAQAVGNLRSAILKECHNQIQDHLLHSERLAEALCSIAILEKASCADVLQALLKARSSVLKDVLRDNKAYGEDNAKNLGEKAKICCSVAIVRQTVLQVFELFCKDNGGLIADLLAKCSDDSSLDSNVSLSQIDSSKLWTKFLPEGVTTIFKYAREEMVISTDIVRSLCLTWFAECEEELIKGIQNSLKFTGTAKDLANIRSALMEILELSDPTKTNVAKENDEWTDPDLDEPKPIEDGPWACACKSLFNREIFLWKDVLSKLFLEKINLLVNATFDKLMEASARIFTLTPESPVSIKAMNSYVWQEHDSDIMANMAWNPWQVRKQNKLSSQGGLSLKTATVTPDVRRACDSVNEMMEQLLSDLNYCAPDLVDEHPRIQIPLLSRQKSIEEMENKAVMEYLKTSCYEFLRSLISHIGKLELELKKLQFINDIYSLDNILHLSLLCRNFFDLCHSFKQCCCQKENVPSSLYKRQLSANVGKARLERSTSVDLAWNEVVDTMHEKSHSLMSVWCTAVLSDALKAYKDSLVASVSYQNLLKSVAIWDSLTVEEENESGGKVTSQIKIPATASSYTVEFLYFLCSEMNRVGGHSASRYTLRHLSQASLKSVYEVFSAARRTFSVGDTSLHGQSRANGASSTPTQTWALQNLFDLRYVHTLLYQPSLSLEEDKADEDEELNSSPNYTFTELVDWLEGYVDPFDLDVFSPHISRNIQRYVARTCVMLGMLSSPEKINTSSTQKFVATSKDSHNVLPLAPDCGRYVKIN